MDDWPLSDTPIEIGPIRGPNFYCRSDTFDLRVTTDGFPFNDNLPIDTCENGLYQFKTINILRFL